MDDLETQCKEDMSRYKAIELASGHDPPCYELGRHQRDVVTANGILLHQAGRPPSLPYAAERAPMRWKKKGQELAKTLKRGRIKERIPWNTQKIHTCAEKVCRKSNARKLFCAQHNGTNINWVPPDPDIAMLEMVQ